MRLIDADVVLKALDEALDEARKDGANLMDVLKMELFKNFIKQIISCTPTIEAEPIRHGHWINACQTKFDKLFFPRTVKCSVCGNYLDFDGINAGWDDTNYCPNCGAKMDEEENDASI